MDTVSQNIADQYDSTGSVSSSSSASSAWGWRTRAQTMTLAAACFLVPPTLGGVPGSGGAMTPEAALSRYQRLHDDSIEMTPAAEKEADLRTPAERLERIRQALGLTVTDLAYLLNTSRPTVYAWLKGQEPRSVVHTQLIELEQQAEIIAAYELPRINKLVRRPLRSGSSLLERLQHGAPLTAALEELQTLAQRERAGRAQPKGRAMAARHTREALDDVAVPLQRG